MISKLLNPNLWKTTIIFSIGWVILFYALTIVQNNGVFNLTVEAVAIIFAIGLVYNLILSYMIPGRYK